jgi:hypothetical protein
MPTNTLQTDFWEEITTPIVAINFETDQWSFISFGTPIVDLETNLWTFSTTGINTLPVYNSSIISSIARVYQNMPFPQFVIAGQGGLNEDEFQLFKKTDTQQFTIWRSPVYNIGKDFDVMSISFNLGVDLESGTSIIPKLYFDNERDSATSTTINAVNYSNDNKLIEITSKNFDNSTHGKHNFFLEFQFTGAALAVIDLPITIDVDIQDT